MTRLEDLTRGTTAKGILSGTLATFVDVQWHGRSAIEVTSKDTVARPGNQLPFLENEAHQDIVTEGTPKMAYCTKLTTHRTP